jgi:hypothetical protein
MRYGKEVNGVKLERDVFADQFAEPGDVRTNYMVYLHLDVIDEDEDKKALAKRLLKYADRLVKIANFLNGKG